MDYLIYHKRQRTTIPTVRLVRPAKTQISLRIRAVWSESSLIACAFYSLQAFRGGMNGNPFHTGWTYRLIWVFGGHTGLIVSFIVRWLINIRNALLFILYFSFSRTHTLWLEISFSWEILINLILFHYLIYPKYLTCTSPKSLTSILLHVNVSKILDEWLTM